MPFAHIHYFAFATAALALAFVGELSGAFRIGAAGVFFPLIIIFLAGFFGPRWFAGFLAFFLLILSFFVAPFWVLEVGGVTLIALLLLFVHPFLTGNRFTDFLALLSIATVIVAVGGGAVRGGVASVGTLALIVLMNGAAGALFFLILERFISERRYFSP